MSDAIPRVVLAVVAYGHQAELPATLDALLALAYPAASREIIVVDNADGACAALAAERGLRTIVPGRNLGFAGGSNAAVAAGDADVVVLVNPDLRPHPDFLAAIVAPLGEPEVGVVGAKLLYADGRTIQHAGGRLEQPRLTAQHTGWGEADDGRWDQARDVEFVTGAALAVRRQVWDRMGGLDSAFEPAYYEDVDFCLSLREQGMQVRYEPRAVAVHLESTALGRATPDYHRLYHRNRLRLLWKHVPDAALIRSWLPAELAYLRDASDDGELAALNNAYLWWQSEFLANQQTNKPTNRAEQRTENREQRTRNQGTKEPKNQEVKEHTDSTDPHEPENLKLVYGRSIRHNVGAPDDATNASALRNSKLAWLLGEVQRKHRPVALPFRSRLPLVARLRGLLSRLVVDEYVRPLTQQQNDFNASTAELLAALVERTERQRRSADAAIACQGMLLAKLLGK